MRGIVYNLKGGVGKTDIALNLALSLDSGIVTNEPFSPIEQVLPDERILKLNRKISLPSFPTDLDLIFDFGGFLDDRISVALKQSDWVIVPVINEFKDLQTTINLIQEIEEFNRRIFIVINKTEKNDFEEARDILLRYYNYPFFEIKKSRALPNIMRGKKSIREMVEGGGLVAYNYKLISEQFDKLIAAIININ